MRWTHAPSSYNSFTKEYDEAVCNITYHNCAIHSLCHTLLERGKTIELYMEVLKKISTVRDQFRSFKKKVGIEITHSCSE